MEQTNEPACTRDYGLEIDALREGQKEIKQMLAAFLRSSQRDEVAKPAVENPDNQRIHSMRNMHPDARLRALMEEICCHCDDGGMTGLVTYLGVFSSGDRQSNWIRNEVNTDSLLALISERKAERVLACIGNNDRLNLVLALLRQPMTVAGLVAHCGYKTPGQVYHHIKPLIAADVVAEDEKGERGVYVVKPHRVQGIVMLLAGIADLLDPKYTQGQWADMQE